MTYNFVVNIGNKKMSEYLSATLLFPYLEKENVFFYFFSKNYELGFEKKLEVIEAEIRYLINKDGNQSFNIIYFDSHYESLLETDDISTNSENNLFYFTDTLVEYILKFDKYTRQFNVFNHVLVFNEPWFIEDQIKVHDRLVEKSIQGLLNKLKLKQNRLFINRIAHMSKDPKPVAFNILSLLGVMEIAKFLKDQEKWIEDFEKKDKNRIRKTIINNVDESAFEKLLNAYVHRLNKHLRDLKLTEGAPEFFYYEEKCIFWKKDTKNKNQDDQYFSFKNELDGFRSISFKLFKNEWKNFEDKINTKINHFVNGLLSVKFDFDEVGLNDKGGTANKEDFKNGDINKTIREQLNDKLSGFKNRIENASKRIGPSLNDKIVSVFNAEYNNGLNEYKQKIETHLKQLPSKESFTFFYGILIAAMLAPLCVLFLLLKWGVFDLSSFIMLLPVSLVIAIIATLIMTRWKLKYYRLLKSMDEFIKRLTEDVKSKSNKLRKEELTALNERVVCKRNYDLYHEQLISLNKREEELAHKKTLIRMVLDIPDIKNNKQSEEHTGENVEINIEGKDYFDILSFLNNSEDINEIFKTT